MKNHIEGWNDWSKNMFSLKDTENFDREWFSGNIYVNKSQNKWFSSLRVTVNWKHPKKEIQDGTIRTYFVVSGTWIFTIDWKSKVVEDWDFFIIEPWHQYEYEGKMILFENNISPNNIFKDKLINVLSDIDQ